MSRARRSVAAAADVATTCPAAAEATAATAAVAVAVHTDVGAAAAAPELLTAAATAEETEHLTMQTQFTFAALPAMSMACHSMLSPAPPLPLAPLLEPRQSRRISPPHAPVPLPERMDNFACLVCERLFALAKDRDRHALGHKSVVDTFWCVPSLRLSWHFLPACLSAHLFLFCTTLALLLALVC